MFNFCVWKLFDYHLDSRVCRSSGGCWWIIFNCIYRIRRKCVESKIWHKLQLYHRGDLVVKRQPLLPRVLSVTGAAAVCRKPFKPPCSNGYDDQNTLARRLWARKRFVPWGSSRPALVAITNRVNVTSTAEKDVVEETVTLPPGIEPLVLWQPEESENGAANLVPIVVDPLLVRFLRPHQRYCSWY